MTKAVTKNTLSKLQHIGLSIAFYIKPSTYQLLNNVVSTN